MNKPSHDPARPDDHGEVHGRQKFQWTPRAVAAVVGLVLAVLFTFSNRQKGEISFLWLHVTMPLWVALFVATLLGFLIGTGTGYRRGKHAGTNQAGKKK